MRCVCSSGLRYHETTSWHQCDVAGDQSFSGFKPTTVNKNYLLRAAAAAVMKMITEPNNAYESKKTKRGSTKILCQYANVHDGHGVAQLEDAATVSESYPYECDL